MLTSSLKPCPFAQLRDAKATQREAEDKLKKYVENSEKNIEDKDEEVRPSVGVWRVCLSVLSCADARVQQNSENLFT